MLTSVRGLLAAAALSGGLFLATPALAQEEEADPIVTVTGNVAIVTDYRFRGVGLSGGDVAIQGGLTLNTAPGFYLGTWLSSLEDSALYGEVEMDIFAGWTGEVTSGVAIDAGVLYYAYPSKDPGAGPSEVWEFYGKVKPTIGPVGLTLGVAYSPDQDSLGGGDNIYLSADAGVGIPGTPLTVTGHAGYTDGALSPVVLTGAGTGGGWDWSIGASTTILGGLGLGVSYVGVDGATIDGVSDDTVVGTLSFTF
ncbi:MAG: hypothetical protein B7Z08_10490 [Sphingomonadales bacterium 32-68-7]|nr:MAG: hypothetical protein B7Z33_07210 [Sphingomonadales bacterium 12-68-11]OYX08200.1 MAG: hypothetical protein B7Z08_10490 [Sphingomonadales bacterium 32-68-7]